MEAKWMCILTVQTGIGKECGNDIKRCVTILLKNLMVELPNEEEKLKTGFTKCGIYPFDKTPVLNRLPQESLNENLDNSVFGAFTEHLKHLRNVDNDGPARKMRRKKLDIVPGRSIVVPKDQESVAEAVAGRAEPETVEVANVSDVPSDEELNLSSEDEWTPVSLGTCNQLYQACSTADNLPTGKHSVKGVGKMSPDERTWINMDDGLVIPVGKMISMEGTLDSNLLALQFNEYVVYDPSQVRLRYLLKIKFNFC
ncbi:unnamed protein product [Dicrocoelium dendriticum]|nr:unnamed protein product [Dicrocoelium dendriticum]